MKNIINYLKRQGLFFPFIRLSIFISIMIISYTYTYTYTYVNKKQLISFILEKLGYVFAAFIALWQIILLNKRTNQQDKTIEIQLNNSIDERFKNAIELLGSDKASTRLGAIYVLHHLAKETFNKEKSYTKSVFDILCSYIREKTNEEDYIKKYTENKKVTIEIQTILNLLFIIETERIAYLKFEADLNNAKLAGVNLQEANLQEANLQEANLQEANLQEANLERAKLNWTKLNWTKLNWTKLNGAKLNSAILDNAILFGSKLEYAELNNANLENANLENANLTSANFKLAKLDSANLQNADFTNANLEDTTSKNANVEGIILTGAKLKNSDFLDLQK